MKIAITGGTGFVGSRLIDAALSAGHQVRALVRRPQPPRSGVEWVLGELVTKHGIATFFAGTDVVIHAAAVLNPRYAWEFDVTNRHGTRAVVSGMEDAGVSRLIHVSSLAAREPDLSLYGESKAAAESFVEEVGNDWTIVRPPAVYGPGDRELLALFRMAKRGMIFMPPAGRASYLHVDDLVRLLLTLVEGKGAMHQVLEPDDGHTGGWDHHEFGTMLARAIGREARPVLVPAPILKAAAWAAWLTVANRSKLTPDRASYFCHPDWVANPAKAVPSNIWQPRIATPEGLAETAAWYRANNWL